MTESESGTNDPRAPDRALPVGANSPAFAGSHEPGFALLDPIPVLSGLEALHPEAILERWFSGETEQEGGAVVAGILALLRRLARP